MKLKAKLGLGLAAGVLGLFLTLGPAKAYYIEPYMPTYNYYPGYANNDQVSALIRGEVNFVSSFTYIPQPVPLYFYNPPAPFAYPYSSSIYGYGNNYGYGFGFGYYGY